MKTRRALVLMVVLAGAVLLTGCGPTAVSKYDAGKSLQRKKDFQQAIKMYEEYIRAYPDFALTAHAMSNVAECYVGLADKPNAMASFKKVIDQFPQSDVARWAERRMREIKDQTLVPQTKPVKKKPAPKPAPKKGSATK